MRTHFAMVALSIALAHGASAQTAAGPEQGQNAQSALSQSEAQKSQAIRDELREILETGGYTEIEMVPSRFLVRAKDKSGNPVMLLINLDSGGDHNATVGQGLSTE